MEPIKVAIREALRTSIVAVIPLAIVQLEAGTLDWRVLAISFSIGLLRGAEKYLHETDRTTGLEFKMIK